MEKTPKDRSVVVSGAYSGLIGWLMTDAATAARRQREWLPRSRKITSALGYRKWRFDTIETAPWGSAFFKARKDYLRMTFLQPEDKLIEGLERMKTAMPGIMAAG